MEYIDFQKPSLLNMEKIARSFANKLNIDKESPQEELKTFLAEDIFFGLKNMVIFEKMLKINKNYENILYSFVKEFNIEDNRKENLFNEKNLDINKIFSFTLSLNANLISFLPKQNDENKKELILNIIKTNCNFAREVLNF